MKHWKGIIVEYKREKERMLRSYLQTIKFLNDSVDEILYLCDIDEQKVHFSSNVAEKFDLPPLNDGVYDVEQIREFVISQEDKNIFLNPEAFGLNNDTVLHQEYRIVNNSGKKFWVYSDEKLQCDEQGRPMWILGRISDNGMEQDMDPLTGLYNTKKLVEDMEECLSKKKTGFLMVLGIDNFKNINNMYGRGYGNQVLKNVAEMLEGILEEKLRVYRLDSDKFAINGIDLEKEEVEFLYKEIQAKIPETFTISSGVTRYSLDTKDVDTIYQQAENALDDAKKNGKNTQEFFSEHSYEEQLENIGFKEELRKSILNDFEGFSINYQPQIDAHTYQIYGAEALLRYTSPTRGPVSPLEFIQVLEQTRMITIVGEWVLRNALAQCKKWRQYIPNFHMGVNFSYIQLKDQLIADHIIRLLKETDLPGNALTLEVTESVQLQDYQFFNKIFYKLEKYGVGVAIDDFGTGYSSLSYLKSIAINEVKIDRCFVTGIQHSAYNYRLLENMVELAHSANIRVCCEGVETEEELRALKELHPDMLQGFLFAKPCSVKEFELRYILNQSEEYSEWEAKQRYYIKLDKSEYAKEGQENSELEKMATIIDGMEEIVYVRDPDTNELFYLNAAGRTLTGAYDYKGRKCYEVLQNKKKPCEFCNKECPTKDSYNVWELYNEYLKKHFMAKDKMISWSGQNARLTICIDITEKEVTSKKVQEKLEFEQNIVTATKLLVEEDNKDKAINGVLALIGEFYDAGRAYLFELQDNKEFWDNTYEWCADGVIPQIDFLQNVSIETTQRWQEQFRKGESIVIEDVDAIKEISPEEYEILSVQGIRSLIVSPIWKNSEVIAFIGVDDPKKHIQAFGQVQTMSYFLADRMRKEDTEQRLGELLTFHSEDILKVTKLGLWAIHISMDGGKNQMFADQTMLEIMGAKKRMTPEECYEFWYQRINDGYYHYVNEAVSDMIENGKLVEIGYTWKHPVKGDVMVRCMGRRVADSNGMICLEGYHRDLKDVERPDFIPVDKAIIFEYNENTKEAYFHNDRRMLAGAEEHEENFPNCWIEKGMVHPHFIKQFEAVFKDVKGQPELEYKEFLLKTKNGDYDWFYLSTKDLSKDEQDADTMIIILESASQERAMELRHMRLKDFYKATLSEKIAYMEIDLESRHVLDIGGLWNAYRDEAMGEGSDYLDVMLKYKESLIHPEDKLAYAQFFGNNLAEGMTALNNYTKKLQYRRLLDGRMQWMEITAHIFEEQYSENLYALIYLKNIDAQKRRELDQETAATRDHLTGVFNRRSFEYQVATHIMETDENAHGTLILLDIDNFKQINDTYGHVEGDKVLKQLTDVLMTTFRRKDILGRLGGDEFMIFLKNVSDREIINRRIEEFRTAFAKVNEHHSTCSIGITEIEKEGFNYSECIKRADAALYRSKEKGKNTYHYYED